MPLPKQLLHQLSRKPKHPCQWFQPLIFRPFWRPRAARRSPQLLPRLRRSPQRKLSSSKSRRKRGTSPNSMRPLISQVRSYLFWVNCWLNSLLGINWLIGRNSKDYSQYYTGQIIITVKMIFLAPKIYTLIIKLVNFLSALLSARIFRMKEIQYQLLPKKKKQTTSK